MPENLAVTSEEVVRTGEPSAPWVGAVVAGLLWAMAAWLMAYTLLDLPFQQALGPWNYLLLLGLVGVLATTLRRWRADTRRNH